MKLRHCVTHLKPLVDANGALGFAEHRKACHVDGQVFSPKGVEACPVCGKDACAGIAPRAAIAAGTCARLTWSSPPDAAWTCRQLAVIADPPDDVLTAARAVTGGGPKSSRPGGWPATTVTWSVELDRGLRRKTVFTLRHGKTVPDSVVIAYAAGIEAAVVSDRDVPSFPVLPVKAFQERDQRRALCLGQLTESFTRAGPSPPRSSTAALSVRCTTDLDFP